MALFFLEEVAGEDRTRSDEDNTQGDVASNITAPNSSWKENLQVQKTNMRRMRLVKALQLLQGKREPCKKMTWLRVLAKFRYRPVLI